MIPCISARSRLGDWKALTQHLITSRARRRNWRDRRVIEAKDLVTLCSVTHIKGVTFLTDSHLGINLPSFGVARPSILLMDTVQKTIHHLKSNPFPVAITFQLHDFLNSTIVCTCCLRPICVILRQNVIDFGSMSTCLLLQVHLIGIADCRLVVKVAVCGDTSWDVLIISEFCSINSAFLCHV
jgi:hypothetical protein